MEQIDIGELNFDTDKVSKGLLDARLQIDTLKTSLSDLRKENRELQKAQAELTKEGKQNTDEFKKNEKALIENTKAIELQEQSLRSVSKEHRDLRKIIDANAKAEQDKSKAIENAIRVSQNEIKTIEQARASNTELLALRNSLDLSVESNRETLQKLNEALDANNQFIKENVSQYEQQKIGIGDYRGAIEDALGQTKIFGVTLNDITSTGDRFSGIIKIVQNEVSKATEDIRNAKDATEGMGNAQKMAFVTTRSLVAGLKLLKVALVSTGIGAIVVVLGSLITYLSTTQEGIDKITSVTRPLTQVFQRLLGIFQELGRDWFNSPLEQLQGIYDFVKKQLVESFTGLGKIIKGVFTLDGDMIREGQDQIKQLAEDNAEMLKNTAKGISNQFKEAWGDGKEIDRLIKELSRSEADFIERSSELTMEFEKQKKIADDVNLTFEEREQAALKAQEAQAEIRKLNIERLEQEREILLLKQKQNDTSNADRVELARINAEINKAIQDESSRTKETQNKINSLRKEAHNAELARIQQRKDAELERQNLILEILEFEREGSARNMADELQNAKDISKQKLAILDAELEAKKISQEEYNLRVKQLNAETAKEEYEITLYYATQALNEKILTLEKERDERTRITQESLEYELSQLQEISNERERLALESLEAGLITHRQYTEQIKAIDAEYLSESDALKKAYQLQQFEDDKLQRLLEHEARLLDLEEFGEIEKELAEYRRQEEREALEQQRLEGKISQENFLIALNNLNRKYAKEQEAIDKAVLNNKLQLYSNALGQISNIFGQETAVGKIFAIAQATIDTYKAANLALATYPPPFGAIAAGSSIATGLGNVAKIKSTRVNMYTGGYTGDGGVFTKTGYTHAGEVVFSQDDVRRLGGVERVESMRPSSDLYGSLPTGVATPSDNFEQWEVIADILGERVERGTERGTNTGMVEAGENEYVRLKSKF